MPTSGSWCDATGVWAMGSPARTMDPKYYGCDVSLRMWPDVVSMCPNFLLEMLAFLISCHIAQSFFGGVPPLSEAWGWGMCLGFGVFFSIVTMGIVQLEKAYTGTKITSEFFNTAGRDVKVSA